MPEQPTTLFQAILAVESSRPYHQWREAEPGAFLVHVFVMEDHPSKREVQVGYYNPVKERMTTFTIDPKDGTTITALPDLEVFKRDETPILPLDRERIGFDTLAILNKADGAQAEYYPRQPIIKRFFILQKLDIGQVYNVTLITRAFKTINLKFDAQSGELLKHHMDSLLSVDSK